MFFVSKHFFIRWYWVEIGLWLKTEWVTWLWKFEKKRNLRLIQTSQLKSLHLLFPCQQFCCISMGSSIQHCLRLFYSDLWQDLLLPTHHVYEGTEARHGKEGVRVLWEMTGSELADDLLWWLSERSVISSLILEDYRKWYVREEIWFTKKGLFALSFCFWWCQTVWKTGLNWGFISLLSLKLEWTFRGACVVWETHILVPWIYICVLHRYT